MMLIACGRGAESDSTSALDKRLAEVDTAIARTEARVDSMSAATTKAACPPTGLWQECSAFDRLDRAGLAPRRDAATVTEPPLTPRGRLLKVGAAELELYIYSDAASRERESARLDRSKYLDYAAPLSIRPLPTLIQSQNLIAVLHSRNEHLRERVGDALSAGPPQQSKP